MLSGQRITLNCPSLVFACSAGHILSHNNWKSNELRLPSQTLASIQKKQFCSTANNRKGLCKPWGHLHLQLGTFTPSAHYCELGLQKQILAPSWLLRSSVCCWDLQELLAEPALYFGAQGCRRGRSSLVGGHFWDFCTWSGYLWVLFLLQESSKRVRLNVLWEEWKHHCS